MADTYCTAQEPLALGMLEAFFAPRRFGCEVPEWSVRKRKSASSGFSAGWGLFCSGSMFKVCGGIPLVGQTKRTLKLHNKGFCREWEPSDARTPDLLRY